MSTPPLPSLLAGGAACDGSRHATEHTVHDLPGAWADRHTSSSWHTSRMGLRMLQCIQKCPSPPKRAVPCPGTSGAGKPTQHYSVYFPFVMLQNCLNLFSKGCSWDHGPSKHVRRFCLGGQIALRSPDGKLAEGK